MACCCVVQVSKKYVSKAVAQEIHDKAAPFIKWLEEAEEEEESSEDEGVEVGQQICPSTIIYFICYVYLLPDRGVLAKWFR